MHWFKFQSRICDSVCSGTPLPCFGKWLRDKQWDEYSDGWKIHPTRGRCLLWRTRFHVMVVLKDTWSQTCLCVRVGAGRCLSCFYGRHSRAPAQAPPPVPVQALHSWSCAPLSFSLCPSTVTEWHGVAAGVSHVIATTQRTNKTDDFLVTT